MKRAFVSLPDGIWKILHKDFKGKMGDGESDVIRNIVISYLSDNGYFITNKGRSSVPKITNRLNILDFMIASLVDILEEKKAVRRSEWEEGLRRKVAENRLGT